MPRTDVPPPGQGKRSQRKAWRDNADQTIAIYNITAEETPKSIATEDLEAMSQALPYWDDAPQPQPIQPIHPLQNADHVGGRILPSLSVKS